MQTLHHRVHPRRLALSLGLALLVHTLLVLLPLPALRGTWGLRGGDGGGASRLADRFQRSALHGAEVALQPRPSPILPKPPVPRAAQEPTPTEPEVADLLEVPEPVLQIADSVRLTDRRDGFVVAGGEGSAAEVSGSDGDTGSGTAGGGLIPALPELAIRPRVYVHPRIPKEVGERKINDYVLVKVLVGTDGRVRDARVLRSIADCDACTQAAVEAARSLRFDPQSRDGRLIEWWNEPVMYEFTASR